MSEGALDTERPKNERRARLEAFARQYDGEEHSYTAGAWAAALARGAEPLTPAAVDWVWSEPAQRWFTRAEVTVAQYLACVEAGKCAPESHRRGPHCNAGEGDRADHPMNCIDAAGAEAGCAWLGGELPSEDDWYGEAAAGETREHPWGPAPVSCEYAVWGDGKNTKGCGRASTWPVCSKRRGDSVSGLCDMSGNVWEWTIPSPAPGRWERTGMTVRSHREIRGGSWFDSDPGLFTTSRGYAPDSRARHPYVGFRCVRATPPSP